MRILKVTQAYYPFLEKGGPALKVRAIAEGLAQRGHTVTVLTRWYDSQDAAEAQPVGGVEVIYQKPVVAYRSMSWNAGLLPFCRRRLADFDLAHFYGLYDMAGPVVAHYCRRRGLPYVLEPLGMTRPIDRGLQLKRLWHLLLGRRLVRDASFWVATSKLEQRELVADGFPAGRTVLRYNGIEPELLAMPPTRGLFREPLGIPPDEPLVVLLGRLIPRKGADLLIAAFQKACPERGRLVIAGPEGEPGYVGALKKKAASCGLDSRVIFTGPLYGAQKHALLCDANVFVLPSHYENFANVVAEALACGTPVVVSDRCGISELVQDRAGLVVPVEENALVKAIRELLNNRTLRERFQAGCRQLTDELRWESLILAQEALYQRALTERDALNTK